MLIHIHILPLLTHFPLSILPYVFRERKMRGNKNVLNHIINVCMNVTSLITLMLMCAHSASNMPAHKSLSVVRGDAFFCLNVRIFYIFVKKK